MVVWRAVIFALVLLLVAVPVLVLPAEVLQQFLREGRPPSCVDHHRDVQGPKLESSQPGSAKWDYPWSELGRIGELTGNTILLIAGTLLAALPLGTLLAVLFFRTDLPCRNLFTFLIVLQLFVPLPVWVSAWQAVLGGGGWLPSWLFVPRAGQPWGAGLAPSVFVHSCAALPWVVVILGHALRSVEREVEEDALMCAGPVGTIWFVTLPRCRPAFVVAALWIAIQTAGEISVTDMFQYRTFAEEIYLVFNQFGAEAQSRAVLISLPPTVLFWTILLFCAVRLQRSYPAIQSRVLTPLRFRLRKYRWPVFGFVCLFFYGFAIVPVRGLIWRCGLAGAPLRWSQQHCVEGLTRAFMLESDTIYWSVVWALAAAALSTSLGLLVCWCIRGFRRRHLLMQGTVVSILAVVWVLPGPLIGLSLKRTILILIDLFPASGLGDVLYYGPSAAPLIWTYLIRTLPFTIAILWPMVLSVPQDLLDAAEIDGATPTRRLRAIILPFTLISVLSSIVVATAVALAEISASKHASTPGVDTFTLIVFDRMHYGVGQEAASLCLALLLLLTMFAGECVVRAKCLRFKQGVR